MRVLVLVKSRQNISAETLSAQIPASIKRADIDVFAGANQKVGFRHALEKGYEAVAVFPDRALKFLDKLPEMISLMQHDDSDLVLGVTRQGPLTAFLSWTQNRLTGQRLKGWHSGIRLYRTRALKEIAFGLNASDDVFDTEVLLQMIYHGHSLRSFQLSGGCACARSPWTSFKAAVKYRLQKYHLFYDVRYHPEVLDPRSKGAPDVYHEKPHSRSPYSVVVDDAALIPSGANVLDVGCASGYTGERLKETKGCRVTGIDLLPRERVRSSLDSYYQMDVEAERERFLKLVQEGNFDAVLLLDIVEHMAKPELFLWSLAHAVPQRPIKIIVSTGNVAFLSVRLMLLLGHFNYGQKGILDITHKRLFSYHTFKNLLQQTGLTIVEERYCPLPFSELGLPGWLASFLEGINLLLMKIRPRLFSYQVMFSAVPLASPQASLVRIN